MYSENQNLRYFKGIKSTEEILPSSIKEIRVSVMHYGDITSLFEKRERFDFESLSNFFESNVPNNFGFNVEDYTEENSSKRKLIFFKEHPEWFIEKYFATLSLEYY